MQKIGASGIAWNQDWHIHVGFVEIIRLDKALRLRNDRWFPTEKRMTDFYPVSRGYQILF